MKRLITLAFILSACAPVTPVIPQARLAGASAELTATAEYAAIAQTASAEDWRAAVVRVQIAQTEVALNTTAQAAEIEAGYATRAAYETAQAAPAEATRQWASAQSAEAGRRAAEWVGWIVEVGLVGIMLALICGATMIAYAQFRLIMAKADEHTSASISAQRFHAPGVVGWYEGGRWYFDSSPLPELPPPSVDPVSDHAMQDQWRQACRVFLVAGDRWGFGVRDIANDKLTSQKVVSVPGWRQLVDVLSGAGVLTTEGGTNRKTTTWADGWDMARWDAGGWKALPHFSAPPPDISLGQRHSVTVSQ